MLLKIVPMTLQDKCDLLKNVNPLSLLGMAIHKALQNPTEEKMDGLIQELQSQAKDNPLMMREILGFAIFNKIISQG